MGTTAEKLQAILDSKDNIKNAIEQKGVTVGTTPLSGYAQKILDIPTENEEEEYDVEFIDYTGDILIGMSKEEFLALSEMPANPVIHEGLISDGWNWTFTDARNYVNKYGMIVIGAMYTTVNGSTWFTINLDEDNLLTMALYFKQSVTQGVLIDWGDGTTQRTNGTSFGQRYHTYAQKGKYTITLTPDTGCDLSVTGGTSDLNGYPSWALQYIGRREQIVIGRVITTSTMWMSGELKYVIYPRNINTMIGNAHFPRDLQAMVFPPLITTITGISNCWVCKRMSFPKNVTSMNQPFYNEFKLEKIILPDSLTALVASAFTYCIHAKYIIIPDSITSIGSNAFYLCGNVKKIYIGDGVTTIGNQAFYYCISLEELKLSNSLTEIPQYCFGCCYRLKNIVIPSGVTTIGNYAFYFCLSFTEINLPDTVQTIGSNSFLGCYNVESLTIPKNVTSIGNSAFQCYPHNSGIANKLTELHMKPTTPPTLTQVAYSSTNSVFSFKANADIKVYVPEGCLTAYQTATNWTMLAQYMIEE